ncbi:MAG: class A beta-lactamase-related serine hydrolase [Gemmatimonadetes bacterium]|nr:class A beta-lactamase-related serine hydrolase [Gemmatimonadota bacterium]
MKPGLAGLLTVAVLGCGGPDPVAPPPPPPPAEVTSLTVTPLQAIVTGGERVTATAVARTAQGSAQATIDWKSSDPLVATVATTGTITATGNGTATITASVGSVSAALEFKVAPPGLGRIVDSVRRAYGLPAMGGAIITSAGTEALAVAGTRRADRGPFVTVDDKWHIGSNLKAVTAALAATVVDQGTLAWSTTIGAAFPDLAAMMRPEYRDVTLGDLLSHRGGIRNDPPVSAFVGATAKSQRDGLAAWTLAEAPVGPVGVFAYSNLGYVLAGAMIERAEHGVYEDLLASRLLQPLGVTGLGWGPQAAAGASDQPVAHSFQNGRWAPCEGCDNLPGLSAAGRAHLPLGDWAKLIREFLAADAGASTLITPATGRDLFTNRVPLTGTDSYGLGWVLVTRGWAGGRAAAHEGSNTVNHSVAWLGLGRGIGFIAVTNAADPATVRTGQALDVLIGRMIGWHDTGK